MKTTLMYDGRPFERKNGSTSSRIASWDYFGNVIAISVSCYKVVAGRIWSFLPFEKKIWLTSRPSIMVSYLKHQSTSELSLPLGFDFKRLREYPQRESGTEKLVNGKKYSFSSFQPEWRDYFKAHTCMLSIIYMGKARFELMVRKIQDW